MQILIDIPDNTTKLVEECIKFDNMIDLDVYDVVLNGIKNGIPLPKGHGRLIDADILETYVYEIPDEYCGKRQVVDYDVIKDAQTIAEAEDERHFISE